MYNSYTSCNASITCMQLICTQINIGVIHRQGGVVAHPARPLRHHVLGVAQCEGGGPAQEQPRNG